MRENGSKKGGFLDLADWVYLSFYAILFQFALHHPFNEIIKPIEHYGWLVTVAFVLRIFS